MVREEWSKNQWVLKWKIKKQSKGKIIELEIEIKVEATIKTGESKIEIVREVIEKSLGNWMKREN